MKSFLKFLGSIFVAFSAEAAAQAPPEALAPAPPESGAREAADPKQMFAPFPGSVPTSAITKEMVDKDVAVVGKVVKVIPSPAERTPTRVIIEEREDGSSVMVIYWPELHEELYQGAEPPKPGTPISVRGKVASFQEHLQIRVRTIDQLRVAGYPSTLKTVAVAADGQVMPGPDGYFTVSQVPALQQTRIGEVVSIRGKIDEFKEAWSETAPNVIMLVEDDQKVEVVFWDENRDPFREKDTPIFATGKLQDYRGRLQVKIDDMADLSTKPLPPERVAKPKVKEPKVVADPATRWPGAPKRDKNPAIEPVKLEDGQVIELNKITPAHAGNTVKVSGAVSAVYAREEADVVVLTADNTTLVVRLPAAAAAGVAVRDMVEVTGKLVYNEVRSEPELEAQGVKKLQ